MRFVIKPYVFQILRQPYGLPQNDIGGSVRLTSHIPLRVGDDQWSSPTVSRCSAKRYPGAVSKGAPGQCQTEPRDSAKGSPGTVPQGIPGQFRPCIYTFSCLRRAKRLPSIPMASPSTSDTGISILNTVITGRKVSKLFNTLNLDITNSIICL